MTKREGDFNAFEERIGGVICSLSDIQDSEKVVKLQNKINQYEYMVSEFNRRSGYNMTMLDIFQKLLSMTDRVDDNDNKTLKYFDCSQCRACKGIVSTVDVYKQLNFKGCETCDGRYCLLHENELTSNYCDQCNECHNCGYCIGH